MVADLVRRLPAEQGKAEVDALAERRASARQQDSRGSPRRTSIYCFKVIPRRDKAFYPSGFATAFSWLSLVVVTGMTGLLILARVFRIELFG